MATRGSEEYEGQAYLLQQGSDVVASGHAWIIVAGSIDASPVWLGTLDSLSPPDVMLTVGEYRLRLSNGSQSEIRIRRAIEQSDQVYEFDGVGDPPQLFD